MQIAIRSNALHDGNYTRFDLVLDGQIIRSQISVIDALDVEWTLNGLNRSADVSAALRQLGMERSPLAARVVVTPWGRAQRANAIAARVASLSAPPTLDRIAEITDDPPDAPPILAAGAYTTEAW